ncbi:hypothetical protein Cni_G26200 [Canna indica]|uniref:Carboxypeptidase n=1 Tax=Canna indica TaxID=4628 RepID=A0AAQ3L2G9_9LILI|nr:hypothetical protein Cni_G26200 [Canna indica]
MVILVPSFVRALTFIIVVVALTKGAWTERLPYSMEFDLVVDLLGQPLVKFRHYVGYVRINDNKSMFYWFYKAMEAPMEKPLLLWLNGANLLFLESPVGLGFSYSNKSSNLENQNDKTTAEDTYTFLINWFAKFPTFKLHELYIAGESYAGHYVPQLASLIHEKNNVATKNSYINFKGLMEMESGLPTDPMAYDPCAYSISDVYLIRLDVQKALHANVSKLPYSYSTCSCCNLDSGDVDAIMPMKSTRDSIMNMNLTEKTWDKWGGWKK